MRNVKWFPVGVILSLFFLGFAGCATTGEHNSLAKEVGSLRAVLSAKADQAGVDQRFAANEAKTTAALTGAVQALERVGQQAVSAAANAANVHSRLNLAEQRLGRVDSQLADLHKADEAVNRELAALKKGVAGARALASSAHKKVGVARHLQGEDQKPFLATGFPSCKFDKERKLIAGAELPASIKKVLDGAWEMLQRDNDELEQIVGFADERSFKSKSGEDSDKLNRVCAQARAEAIRDYLEVGDIGDKLKVAGPTSEFGELAANRAGLVVVRKKQAAAPAATPPVVPTAPAPAGPAKP